MVQITDFNPYLPSSEQIQPSKEGGNGTIHKPGKYQNVIQQTRHRVPDGFECALIAGLEEIFETGVNELDLIVNQLNQKRLFDRNGHLWTDDSFRQFLTVNGY